MPTIDENTWDVIIVMVIVVGLLTMAGSSAALWDLLFKPYYEEALIEGHMRPVFGWKLCLRCKPLKRSYGTPKKRIQHYDDYAVLTDSAAAGCWCCGAVAAQFDVALQDAETPPAIHVSSDLKVPRLFMWFAERT
jgi:hypothetical protein